MEQEVLELPWWRRPMGLGLIGLVLMVAGWKLSILVNFSSRESEQAQQLEDLRQGADDAELRERLDRVRANVRRDPPFELPGRLLMFAGILLFVSAAVQMYRQPARAVEPREDMPEEAEADQ